MPLWLFWEPSFSDNQMSTDLASQRDHQWSLYIRIANHCSWFMNMTCLLADSYQQSWCVGFQCYILSTFANPDSLRKDKRSERLGNSYQATEEISPNIAQSTADVVNAIKPWHRDPSHGHVTNMALINDNIFDSSVYIKMIQTSNSNFACVTESVNVPQKYKKCLHNSSKQHVKNATRNHETKPGSNIGAEGSPSSWFSGLFLSYLPVLGIWFMLKQSV